MSRLHFTLPTRGQVLKYLFIGIALWILGLIITRDAIPDCVSESDELSICVWDASRLGNGRGDSFISIYDITIYFGATA